MRTFLPEIGLSLGYTFYSFRNETNTKVERELCITVAQKTMDHAIGSRAFYELYDKRLSHYDPVGIMVEDEEEILYRRLLACLFATQF